MLLSSTNSTTGTNKVIAEEIIEPVAVQEIEVPYNIITYNDPEIITERPARPKRVTVSRSLPARTKGKFKTYMDYKMITNKQSVQWSLQQDAITDNKGFRIYDNKYMIAVGSYYSKECGKHFIITLDSGATFDAIVGDIKQDKHTDESNMFVPSNGNIIEFIVDSSKLSKLSKKMGDVSYSGLEGNIIHIEEVIIDD